jgi:mannose/cellobiose epimerase-like protein (N-acyl-D-glucosamine 2-epimerase family)
MTDDGPLRRDKTAYEHAFVVLAASSTVAAGAAGGDELLDAALGVLLGRFWDENTGMVVEQWDESFSSVDPYRGVNANMHAVEALLAAHDVTGDASHLERAQQVVARVVHELARGNHWRIPEHFDSSWTPTLEYNRDEPAHPFRPYGATVGHWLEWARLALHLRAALGSAAPQWLLDDAVSLFDAALREGWHVDGSPGFVYTVDWSGRPVVRQRMHWVAAEATAAAYALWVTTGEKRYADHYEQWWEHIVTAFRDPVHGSWWHELGPDLKPSAQTWSGKPDAYHAVQATLIPRLPLAPTLASALRERHLG